MKAYLTPAGFGQAELIEKRSRFIARLWPVSTEEEAHERIREVRALHPDASHNVYAYKIRESGAMRYSDDGEPGGTSGLPTMNVFLSGQIEDFCCVVTRYFGGTLLGSGGLSRAYSGAAKLALTQAGLLRMDLFEGICLGFPYARYERVKRICEDRGAVIDSTGFGEDVTLTVFVPRGEAEDLASAATDACAGEVRWQLVGEKFMGTIFP